MTNKGIRENMWVALSSRKLEAIRIASTKMKGKSSIWKEIFERVREEINERRLERLSLISEIINGMEV